MAMIGGTILIPILMGMSPSLGLLSAGIGTLVYAFCTKEMIPIFLGSSAGYLGAFLTLKGQMGIEVAVGSLIGASITYLLVALLVKKVGYKVIKRILPNTLAGAVIVVIGLSLVPIALSMASSNYTLALISAVLMIFFCSSRNKYISRFPLLLTMLISYIIAIMMGLVDFSIITNARWFAFPQLIKPSYNLNGIFVMMIIAFITILEHIGELTANGIVVGQNHFEKVGLHRSLLGDGITLIISGLTGLTPLTTYGENTSVISVTGNKNPRLIQGAGVIAILLSLFGKFGAFLSSIPMPIIGGISFILFGMITMAGLTTIKESKVNLMDFRNAVVIFLPIFIGVASLIPNNPLKIVVNSNLTLEGLSLSAIVGIVLNLIIPRAKGDN